MPSVVGGAIAAAGAIGSAVIGSTAAQGAASTQAEALQSGQALQAQMFNKVQGNLQPYMTAGQSALNALMWGLGLGGPSGGAGMLGGSSGGAPGPAAPSAPTNLPTGYWGYDTGALPLGATYSGGGNYTAPSGSDNTMSGTLPLSWLPVPQSSLTAASGQTAGGTGGNNGTGAAGGSGGYYTGDYSSILGPSGSLIAKFQPTIQQLEQTPGYQFVLNQGLQGVQNSYAASGLGSSGPALKGAANYAEGLAGTTYQQQFQNYLTQNAQIYNLLGGIMNTGQASAAGMAGLAVQSGANQASLLGQAGSALAAGQVGSANAVSGALNGIGSNALTLGLLKGSGIFGGGSNSGAGNYLSPVANYGVNPNSVA